MNIFLVFTVFFLAVFIGTNCRKLSIVSIILFNHFFNYFVFKTDKIIGQSNIEIILIIFSSIVVLYVLMMNKFDNNYFSTG